MEADVVWLGQPPLRVDFLRAVDGVPAEEVLARSVAAELDGVAARFISLDDLVANKRAVGRPQDAIDVEFLERVRART